MQTLRQIVDILWRAVDAFLHLDKYLDIVLQACGGWTYFVLFLVILCETGLVILPLLPGDSLLFAAGTFAALGSFSLSRKLSNPEAVIALFVLLSFAAIIGDTINYWIGKKIGPKIFHKENVRFLNKKHLLKAHQFYERYGGKTIIIARFVPIIRTFAPFVAGIGEMTYWRFISYNIIGGVSWIAVCLSTGYFFGNLNIVRNNFSLVILAIIFISILPAAIEFVRERNRARNNNTPAADSF
jgi:membrane-associated protein